MNEANVDLSQWDANWASAWNIFVTQTKPLSINFLSPCSLTSLLSLWLILADRGPEGRDGWEEKESGGKKKNCTSPKNFRQSLHE